MYNSTFQTRIQNSLPSYDHQDLDPRHQSLVPLPLPHDQEFVNIVQQSNNINKQFYNVIMWYIM